MFKLVGGVALLLTACSSFGPDSLAERELTWSRDRTCLEPDEIEAGWIEEGFLLWSEHWGVSITEVTHPPDDGSLYFDLCPTPEHPRPGYGGWAEMQGGHGRISFYVGPAERYFIATVAHEAGHLILHGDIDDHLPEPLLGIMSSGIDCGEERCVWSDADIAHMAHFGLI